MENYTEKKAQTLFVLNFVERSRFKFLKLDYEKQLEAFNQDDQDLLGFISYYPKIEMRIAIERSNIKWFLKDWARDNGVKSYEDWLTDIYKNFGLLVKHRGTYAKDLTNELATEYGLPAESLFEAMFNSEFVKEL